MKKILCLAAFIYILLAPMTYHPDNKLVLFWAGQEQGNVWNIWQYGQEHFAADAQFNYPPLHFYLDKVQYTAAKLIGGEGFDQWLSSPNSQDAHQENIVRYTMAIKAMLIIFTLIVGYLIYLIAKQHSLSDKQALVAASLWLFNPIVIYSIPVMGQNDVMAIMLFLWGWLLLARSKIGASIIFGLSASVKMYPLLWLPFLLLPDSRLRLTEKFKIVLISIGVYILTLLPFISNQVFREAVLNSDINDRFFIGQIDLGFTEALFIVPLLLMLTFYGAYRMKKNSADDTEQLANQSLAVLTSNLVLLGFSHFHPQWFTWLIPFWSLWLIAQKRFSTSWVVLVSLLTLGAWALIVLLFNDSYLTLGLLIPINAAFANIPMIRELLVRHGVDIIKYNNFAHTWLAGIGSVLLIILYLKNEDTFKKFSFLKLPHLKIHKVVSYLLMLAASFLAIFVFIFATYLVPAPLSSQSPNVNTYLPLTTSLERTFVAEQNNLKRVDLYFRNPDLANADNFIFKIAEYEGVGTIAEIPFSGFNSGDPGVIRFEFAVQPSSKDKMYVVTIIPQDEPIEESLDNLKIGYSEPGTVAVKSFYAPARGVSVAVNNALATLQYMFNQVPWVYLLALVLLFLAL